jgi:hypothetical protein
MHHASSVREGLYREMVKAFERQYIEVSKIEKINHHSTIKYCTKKKSHSDSERDFQYVS